MKKKLSKLELALKKIASALQAYVNDHIADIENPHGVTKTQIGLENVTNDAQVKRTEMGVANGVATLDVNGKIPSSQLPTGDIIEGYFYNGNFYELKITNTGPEYVEIGGVKWATTNIGAESVTDAGLYFQWADTDGYAPEEIGNGTGLKPFGWADYKYGNNTNSPGVGGMSKYNSTDNKVILDSSDDIASIKLGGDWRLPTPTEYQSLGAAVNTAWTNDYQGSGVAGLICTDKTDNTKVLFFPAAGIASNDDVDLTSVDYASMYFTVESLEDNNTISFNKSGNPSDISISYSTDNGSTWTDLSISYSTPLATINTGDKLLIKGTNDALANAWNSYYRIHTSKTFNVYGNAMSLLWGDQFTTHSEFKTGTSCNLCALFYTTDTVIDASNLILPATTCTIDCYNGMFRGATNLQYGPNLPATTPAKGCYSSMFESCINLEEAPEINLTTTALEACKRMFCMDRNNKITTPKLTKSPILRCLAGAENCYNEMFNGNGNLVEVTCLMLTVTGCNNWLVNVSSTGTFRKASGITWTTDSTSGIPTGWTTVEYTESILDNVGTNGYYWSNTRSTSNATKASSFTFNSSGSANWSNDNNRFKGFSLRAINDEEGAVMYTPEKGKIYIDKETDIQYRWDDEWIQLTNSNEALVNILYNTLKTLRDNSLLVPGTQYRIIDYDCTTIQEDTRSAGNSFDIIVTADNEYTLNENARAVRQEGDEYYANSNLTAWLLRYTLDNVKWSERPYTKITLTNPSEDWYFTSTDKIVEYNGTLYRLWLGSYEYTRNNGKYAASVLNYSSGTDLYLYDEETEEVYTEDKVGEIGTITNYYDEGKGTILWMRDEFGNECPYDFKNIQFKRWKAYDSYQERARLQDRYVSAGSHRNPSGITNLNNSDFIWAYTFSNTSSGSTIEDYSLNPKNNKYFGSYGNIIKENTDDYLNNIVIYNRSYYNYFGNDCLYITIADYSSGDCSYNNIFEGENRKVILGRSCSDNRFKNRASYSMVRGRRNIIGETCTDILLYETYGNRIGENGTDIKILVDCNNNIIGSHCNTIELSTMGEGNRIGDYCSNIWGIFIGTTIGNYCDNIYTEDNRICAYSKIESGNSNLILTTNSGTTSALYNITIASGVNSSSDSDKTITHDVANNSTLTVYRPIGSQDVYI